MAANKKTRKVHAPSPTTRQVTSVAKQTTRLPKWAVGDVSEYETVGEIRTPRDASLHGELNKKRATGKAKMRKDVPAIQQKQMTFGDHEGSVSWRVFRIMSEYVDGFEFLSKLERTVTFFGSARLTEESPYYQKARALAERLAREGFTIVTGGGPGIMEAGNRGAVDANGKSIGLNIELPLEQEFNPYVKQGIGFHYFMSRKFMLDYSALAYVFFPGGFGTLDELFTISTLIQTGKADRDVPVVLIGREFWMPLLDWIKHAHIDTLKTVAPDDLKIWQVTDDLEEAVQIICDACN